MTTTLHDKLSAAGKRGGATTKARYGVEHFRHLGQGRPTFFESVRRAKEREDRSPDPSWLAIYANEKQMLLQSLGLRQYHEPQKVDDIFAEYWL